MAIAVQPDVIAFELAFADDSRAHVRVVDPVVVGRVNVVHAYPGYIEVGDLTNDEARALNGRRVALIPLEDGSFREERP